MVNLSTICILIALFSCILFSLLEDLILGDQGKRQNMAALYQHLKGREEEKGKAKENLTRSKKRKHYLLYAVPACTLVFFLALLILKSLSMAVVVSLFGLVYPHIKIKNAENKKKEKLNLQFKDALHSLAVSLKAGMSLNTALLKCTGDLERRYAMEKENLLLGEFQKIANDLNMGISVDEALNSFKERVKMEDVEDFVTSVIIVRQKGGNMAEVMSNVATIISDKIAIKKEIEVLTAAKKAEAKIITAIPIVVLAALSLLAPRFLEPLYNNLLGRLLIILGLLLLVANYYIGRRIVNIKV